MTKASLTRASHEQTGGGHPTQATPRHDRWTSVRHYLEMVGTSFTAAIAMLPLMLVVMARRRAEYGHRS